MSSSPPHHHHHYEIPQTTPSTEVSPSSVTLSDLMVTAPLPEVGEDNDDLTAIIPAVDDDGCAPSPTFLAALELAAISASDAPLTQSAWEEGLRLAELNNETLRALATREDAGNDPDTEGLPSLRLRKFVGSLHYPNDLFPTPQTPAPAASSATPSAPPAEQTMSNNSAAPSAPPAEQTTSNNLSPPSESSMAHPAVTSPPLVPERSPPHPVSPTEPPTSPPQPLSPPTIGGNPLSPVPSSLHSDLPQMRSFSDSGGTGSGAYEPEVPPAPRTSTTLTRINALPISGSGRAISVSFRAPSQGNDGVANVGSTEQLGKVMVSCSASVYGVLKTMLTMRTERRRDREAAAARALEEKEEKARAREEAQREKEEAKREREREREEARREKEEEKRERDNDKAIARAEREQIRSEQKEIIDALKTLTETNVKTQDSLAVNTAMAKHASETMEKALQQNADFLKNSIEQAFKQNAEFLKSYLPPRQ